MTDRKRKSGWKAVVGCVLLLPVVYWLSAPATLWAWMRIHPPEHYCIPPEKWVTIYAPVIWTAEKESLSEATIKPFKWLGVDYYVQFELNRREFDRQLEAM